MWALLYMLSVAGASLSDVPSHIIRHTYPGFALYFDCESGRPIAAEYSLEKDDDNIKRQNRFFIDNTLPSECKKQISTSSYKYEGSEYKYDRGHLVPANHLDNDKDAIYASNYMSNIVPQESYFNRNGAWRETESRIECWRDEAKIHIFIGVIWDGDTSNDYFVSSHGIETPEAFVKIVHRPETSDLPSKTIAWHLTNTPIRAKDLEQYVISPNSALDLMPNDLGFDGSVFDQTSSSADWPVPKCSQS